MTLNAATWRVLLLFCLCIGLLPVMAQNTILSTGSWDNTVIWSAGNIANTVAENVAFGSPGGIIATVPVGASYVVGDVDLESNTIDVQGSLEIGQAGNPKNVTAGSNATLVTTSSINSILTIWGNLTAGEAFMLSSVTQIIVKGDVTLGNSSTITISLNKNIKIEGNLVLGDDVFANLSSGATLDVTGDIIAGQGALATGGGVVLARSCAGASSFCNGVVLPIRLLDFTAHAAGDEVVVKWSTTSEINVDYITVQRSLDGRSFTDVGTVKAFGNSNTIQNYSLTDSQPVTGNLYYRLHSVDLDGKEEYSRVIAVRYLSADAVAVYPNPARSQVNIQLNFSPNDQTTHVLTDIYGRTIKQFTTHAQRETLEMPGIKPGVYFLKTKSGKDVFLNRIVFTEER